MTSLLMLKGALLFALRVVSISQTDSHFISHLREDRNLFFFQGGRRGGAEDRKLSSVVFMKTLMLSVALFLSAQLYYTSDACKSLLY